MNLKYKLSKSILLSTLLLGGVQLSQAQQVEEKLNRAPVAVKASNGILVSWRSLKGDDAQMAFNVYRNGTLLNTTPITTKTNFLDKEGVEGATYKVECIVNGAVKESAETKAWNNMFTSFNVSRPDARANHGGSKGYYFPDDMSVGDLDGDGEYEYVLKWMPNNSKDNGTSGYTSPCVIDAYKADGTLMWRIDLGLNIRTGNHYTQFLVYDFDGDGKAEMICKTAPGSTDAAGNYVSEAATDAAIKGINNTKIYLNSNGHVTGGEELLTVFNGETGKAMHTNWYSPNRARTTGNADMTYADWESVAGKSTNYNRGERYNAAVAHLDGTNKLPSAIMQRGYYTYCYLWAVDWNGTELKTRWLHSGIKGSWQTYNANNSLLASGTGSSSYGQGVHGISVADVNGDGLDDIITGGATIGHDGRLMCSTGKGHGDALHVADLCPDRPGLEVMMPHEESPFGYDVHDGTTGELIYSATSDKDNGRGLAADYIPANRGFEFWSSADNNIRSCTDGTVLGSSKPDCNFRIYWTGDPYDQTFDGRYSDETGKSSPRILTYNTSSKGNSVFQLFTSHGDPQTCNTTKATPCIQADLFGDWREEIVMYQYNGDLSSKTFKIMIFSTPEETEYKVPCLMQDHQYRMAVAWQNSSYNQPPHLGYNLADYLGVDGSTYATKTTSHAPAYTAEVVEVDENAEHFEIIDGSHYPSADKDKLVGTSFTAGENGELTASPSGSYLKIRTNINDQIVLSVNQGYIITGIELEGYSNNKSATADRSIDLIGVYVDGTEDNKLASTVTYPGGTSGQKPVKATVTDIEATKNIVMKFDNSKITTEDVDKNGKNKQLFASITIYYKVAETTGVKTVKLGVSGNKAVLYNAAGQIVATGEFDINSLNIPSGIYILNANGETKKIFK